MKIVCIGRNYVAHIRELKNDMPEEPVFFMKPASSLLKDNRPFHIPAWSANLHHEIELVMRICRTGKDIPKSEAGVITGRSAWESTLPPGMSRTSCRPRVCPGRSQKPSMNRLSWGRHSFPKASSQI